MTEIDQNDGYLSPSYEIDNSNSRAERLVEDFIASDFFSSCSDDNLMALFIPICGIDYDPNYLNEDMSDKKKNEDRMSPVYRADEFLHYRMIPHLNPAYHKDKESFENYLTQYRAREVINLPNSLKQAQQSKIEMAPRLCIDENVKIVEESVPSPTYDMKTVNKMTIIQDDGGDLDIDVEGVEQDDEDEIDEEERLTLLKRSQKYRPRSLPYPTPANKSKCANKKNPPKDAKELPQMIEDGNKQETRQIVKRKPRTYKYNPKPLQQKANRAFVRDDSKDVNYWEHRKRNNQAAKKSRKDRREKELQIVNEFENMKNENFRLKERIAVLEKQVNELKER